ncbi:MAG TPA: 2'-5' RNA ligase family protein [Candidatus Saccharimonadales bacterium]|nr:2'-5' RNA ligase family protein [Candidatus Saccharimonadales bacterium]
MPERLTVPIDPSQQVIGYSVNSNLPEELYAPIQGIQAGLKEKFSDAIWAVPRESLHITLMDWLVQDAHYGREEDELFHDIKSNYIYALTDILKHQEPIQITFDKIEVYPAAIIVKGHDDGSYQRIREEFLQRVKLLPGTKTPPKIIHTTICKFLKQIDATEVEDFVKNEALAVQGDITEFWLARESLAFMGNYDVLQRFPLLPETHK